MAVGGDDGAWRWARQGRGGLEISDEGSASLMGLGRREGRREGGGGDRRRGKTMSSEGNVRRERRRQRGRGRADDDEGAEGKEAGM
jgi:hypothetical protein